MTGVLGVSTLKYAPWAFFNYLTPIIAVIFGFTGFRVDRVEPEAEPVSDLDEELHGH
jgi:NhaC family Na+:H+ antiporter